MPLLDSTSNSSHGRGFTHPGADTLLHPRPGTHQGTRIYLRFPKQPGLRQSLPILSLTHPVAPPHPAHLNEGTRGHTYP